MSTTSSTTATEPSTGRPTLTLRPLTYKPLHSTFVAEVEGADLVHATPELVDEIKRGLAKVDSRPYISNQWNGKVQ